MEHTDAPYSAGDLVKVKKTGHECAIAYSVACGEPGRGEVRYYLDNAPGLFYYSEDLELLRKVEAPKENKRRFRRHGYHGSKKQKNDQRRGWPEE